MDRPAQGAPVAAYRADAQALSLPEFAAKHADYFIVLQEGLSATDTSSGRTMDPLDSTTGSVRMSVYAVRRKPDSKVRFVSIGRTVGNDVVLPDRSVSKFHAFFPSPHEAKLHDGGSHNGTYVNGVKVKGRGEGPPHELQDGDTIKLGAVTLTFVTAEGMRSFAQGYKLA
jgi:pSer/pThr/pTyr-binding forkhead associated (FHA) protein